MSLQSTFHRYRPVASYLGTSSFLISTTDATSYTTGSVTPVNDDLFVVFVVATDTVAAGSVTSSTGLTFTKITSVAYHSGADTIYLFVADQLTTAIATTVTFDCSGDAATGAMVWAQRITGMAKTGAAAVLQTASSTGASGTPAITFGANVNTNNPTLGIVGNGTRPATLTPPTGWTEETDSGYDVPTTGSEIIFRASGFTGTTITWGNSSSTPYGVLVAELDWS